MGWATAISSGLQLAGSLYGASQQRKAADAAKKASQQGIAEWQGARDQAQGYLSDYRGLGQSSVGGLQALNGGDYSGFMNSPDFKARVGFANEQFNNGAAAKFRLFSGGAQNDRDQLNQNLAAQGLGDYRNSLFQGAQMGQNAANQSGAYSMGAANGIAGGLAGLAGAAQQRAGANAGLGYAIGGIGANLAGGFGGSGGGQQFGSSYAPLGQSGSGNNPFYSGNWTSGLGGYG